MSHSRTVLSSKPEIARRPSVLKVTLQIMEVCPLRHSQAFTAFDVPQPNCFIIRAGDSMSAIRAKGDAPDSGSVSFEHSQAFIAFYIPQPNCFVKKRQEIARRLSELKAVLKTEYVCSSSTLRHLPLSMSHSRTVLSPEPEIACR